MVDFLILTTATAFIGFLIQVVNTYGFLTPFGATKVGGIQRRALVVNTLYLSTAGPHEEPEPSPRFSSARIPILITGNNIHLTGPIRDYVYKKIGHALEKVGQDVTKVDCHLVVNKNPRVREGHTAEVTVYQKGNVVIRAMEKSESMYASIDLVTHLIVHKLSQGKDKAVKGRYHRISIHKATEEAEIAWQDEHTPEPDDYMDPKVVDEYVNHD